MTIASPVQHALDVVESLPREDQQAVAELITHRVAEQRREEIARNAKETLQAVRTGRAKSGSIEELQKDLLAQL